MHKTNKIFPYVFLAAIIMIFIFAGSCGNDSGSENSGNLLHAYDQNMVMQIQAAFHGEDVSVETVSLRTGEPVFASPPQYPDLIIEIYAAHDIVLYQTTVGIPRWRMGPPPQAGDMFGGALYEESGTFTCTLPVFSSMEYISLHSLITDQQIILRVSSASLPQPESDTAYITVLDNGDPAQNLDIVFIGDDYAADNMALFRSDVDAHLAYLLKTPPFNDSSFAGIINVHRIDNTRDLGCEHNCGGIARLICCDNNAVFDVAAAAPYDEIIVLYNNDTYGGSGTLTRGGGGRESYAIAYHNVNALGREVSVHEFGHSFGGLMDEYEYGYPTGAPDGPNCDYAGCGSWQDVPGVGCYAGCSYDNLYRPTFAGCLMRTLSPTGGYIFCNVCVKQIGSLLAFYADPLPPIPGDLTADTGTSHAVFKHRKNIRLTWSPVNSPGVTGYYVYRKDPNGTYFKKLHTTPITENVFIDFSLNPDQTYDYVVTAITSYGRESLFSNQVSG